jgi:hypothetical protein
LKIGRIEWCRDIGCIVIFSIPIDLKKATSDSSFANADVPKDDRKTLPLFGGIGYLG